MELVALVRRLRVLERDACRDEIRLRLRTLRARLRRGRARVRVVEARDDVARSDTLAFLDRNLDDLAGDLGGHRGLAARDDVTRRVEDRARSDDDIGRRGLGGRDADRGRARQRVPCDPARDGDAHDDRERPHDPAHAPVVLVGWTLDAQLIKQLGLVAQETSPAPFCKKPTDAL